MAEILRLPRMSDTMEEGVIVEVMMKVGDTISSGDEIAEVETDKAAMPLETFEEGTVLHLFVNDGDTIPVNGPIAIIGEEGEAIEDLIEEAKNGASDSEEKSEESKEETSTEESDDKSAEKSEKSASESSNSSASSSSSSTNDGRIKASPLAKSMAKENGIALDQIKGTGEDGRVVKRDVEDFIENGASAPQQTTADAPKEALPAMPTFVGEEKYTEAPVSQMRKTIAKRLAQSKFGAPHFYLTMSINMDNAIAARKQLNASSPVKISFNDIVIKATAAALKQHPQVNSSWLGDKIRTNEHVNIGMAVAVPDGLVVPVIRFTDGLSLSQIAAASKNYAQKAKDRKITPDDMQGNTFTISNLGMMGIEEFTAIINPPDACILAVGGIKQIAGVVDGNIQPINEMKVTLSCDHRVVDGMVGSQFLNTLKNYLENPITLLV